MKTTPKTVVPRPGLVITESVRLAPGVHTFGGADGLVIGADDILVDGAGATLRADAKPPVLPEGDLLYTPGDLGLSREEHSLLIRSITLPENAAVRFECLCWGAAEDPAILSLSRDRQAWTHVPSATVERREAGWQRRSWDLDARWRGTVSLRFSVCADASTPGAPLFYDAFRILHGDAVLWRGDAQENWKNWYNTGFSIFRRESHGFYSGVALRATGRRGVTLRNLRAEGFLTGLFLTDCTGWIIEGNDFSGNYDCPDYGWGEGTESFGALYMDRVGSSILRNNRATRVWNGISLRRSTGNTIVDNEFSRCSNVCLKMSQSSDNLVADNILSWGLRIYPGEVHARDSVSLLVESGSDNNRFLRNDFSHGGDGIFIRVLNHWCSMGNYFEDNDCSYANNNAVESWSPGNTYVRNRANWSSYGFWLGGSDDTLLLGNEVVQNGIAFKNAPEPFGHAGVSVVHGSSTHFVMADNLVSENRGCGLSFAFAEETPARHWLVAGNRIRRSRSDTRGYMGRGIQAEMCRDVWILGNTIRASDERNVVLGKACRDVVLDSRPCVVVHGLRVGAPQPMVAGTEVTLEVGMTVSPGTGGTRDSRAAFAALEEFQWDFGDGTSAVTRAPLARHTFGLPGRARVTVSCRGRGRAGMASRILAVAPSRPLLADCSTLENWSLAAAQDAAPAAAASLEVDPTVSVLGRGALVATVRAGTLSNLTARFPQPKDLSGATEVSFFYRYVTELFFIVSPRIRTVGIVLHAGTAGRMDYLPEYPSSGMPSEDRYDWVYMRAPLAAFHAAGNPSLSSITAVEILFGPSLPADCIFRIDALSFGKGDA